MSNTKRCSKCEEEKPPSAFRKEASKKDGLQSQCKECRRAGMDPEKVRKSNRRYYAANLEKCRESRRAYAAENPPRGLYQKAKVRARRHALPFTIQVSDIVIPKYCPVLGIELKTGNGKPCDESPSLDKIIPKLGYVKDNIEVISSLANRMKNSASAWHLFRFCQYYSGRLVDPEHPLGKNVLDSQPAELLADTGAGS